MEDNVVHNIYNFDPYIPLLSLCNMGEHVVSIEYNVDTYTPMISLHIISGTCRAQCI